MESGTRNEKQGEVKLRHTVRKHFRCSPTGGIIGDILLYSKGTAMSFQQISDVFSAPGVASLRI